MADEAASADLTLPVPIGARVRAGLGTRRNWLELLRFGLVGASGYAVNLVTFALCVHGLGLGYLLAATVASAGMVELPAQAVAIAAATPLTFLGNKLWTFRA